LSTYPNIKLVYGTIEDSNVIEAEAARADVVLHFASSDHVGAAQAIRRGLEMGKGGIWVHTSGTNILLDPSEKKDLEREKKIFDDWDGVSECLSLPGEKLLRSTLTNFCENKRLNILPETYEHGPVDKIVRSSFSSKVKIAIICPPTIWGRGRVTGNTSSHQIYELTSINACPRSRRENPISIS
jgi:hypothetical protein